VAEVISIFLRLGQNMDPQLTNFLTLLDNPTYAFLFILLSAWSLAWKGFALWRAARNRQNIWFIVLLILNTFGILEIVYVFYFNKPKVSTDSEQAS
jgi:hypothetical protein